MKAVISSITIGSAVILVAFSGCALRPPADSEATVLSLCGARPLTYDARYGDAEPSVSPDGKRVVFTRTDSARAGKWRLWIVPFMGGNAHPLTPDDFTYNASRASWSPDGTVIAFRASQAVGDRQVGGIWLINSDGTNPRRLTDGNDYYPQWFRSGTRLALTRTEDQDHDNIWVVALDGSARQITTSQRDGKSTMSPDETQIAFASDRGGKRNVWIVSAKEGESSARPFTFGGGRGPAWSPDGRWIAFGSDRGGTYAIYLKPVAGGPVRQVTDGSGNEFNPEWSPDGTFIVAGATSREGIAYIEVIDVRCARERP